MFERLFDDAALFPPGNAPMTDAVPAHRGLQQRLAPLVGPFVVPAQRLDELIAELAEPTEFAISLIASAEHLPAAVDRVVAPRGQVAPGLEIPEVPDADAAATA